MTSLGRNGRTLAIGLSVAAGVALFTWWFVSGLAICPSVGDLAAECRAEADRIGLKAAAYTGGFVALITAFVLLGRRPDR